VGDNFWLGDVQCAAIDRSIVKERRLASGERTFAPSPPVTTKPPVTS
jgi:hypothetical protein